MSFYGNISNAGKTNLTFDKIYSNRRQMESNAKTDGVFVNRFVLVEYDDNTFSRRRGFIDEELNIDLIRAFEAGQLEDEYNIFEVYEDSGRRIPYVLEQGNVENGYGIEAYELIEVECEQIIGANGNPVTLYFYCTEQIYLDQTDRKFVACKLMDTSIAPQYALSDYALNYQLDEEWSSRERDLAEGFHTSLGWDSTIWQKVIENGQEKYKMVGTLNSKVPVFKIKPEAPSIMPIAPHFGYTNNMSYDLHLQPNWGLKVKKAEPIDILDENGEVVSQIGPYTDQEINYNIKQYNPDLRTEEWFSETYDGAIYFNKEGFKPEKRSKITDLETEFSLLPTGYSVQKDENGNYEKRYVTHRDGQAFEAAPDIQELTIHLPDIGNAISDLWDLVYGEYEYEDGKLKLDENGRPIYKTARNLDIEWDSITGTRLVTENENKGGFYYNEEKTQTIAGSINSIHDLMGMIIINSEGLTELGVADTEHIYYGDYGGKGYESFYIKTPKCTYTEISENNFQNMLGQRSYFDLTQYRPNLYYTKNYKNYYLRVESQPPADSQIYSLDPTFIQLKQWNEVEIPEDPESRIDITLEHYYKDLNENYIFDDNKNEATVGREYYSILPKQATYPKGHVKTTVTTEVYNPIPRTIDKVVNEKEFYTGYVYFKYREVEDEIGNIVKEYLDEVYELVPQAYEYDAEGKPQLKFADEEKTIPMWDYSKVSDVPYPEDPDGLKREYFYVDSYYLHSVTSIDGLDQAIYYGNNAMNSGNMPPESERVVFIDFNEQPLYLPEGFDYLKMQDAKDCEKEKIYYTIIATPETGMLPLEKDEELPEEGEETPEVLVDTHYYVKDKYYYKYGNNYIFGSEDSMQKGYDYYIIPEDLEPIKVNFYTPGKYNYETVVIEDGVTQKVEILDNDLEMKTSETPNIVIAENGLIYYINLNLHVIKDSLGILSPGSIWDSATYPPDTIKVGVLYLGGDYLTVKEDGTLEYIKITAAEEAEKLYQWTELKGFSRTLNTINGLILKLNQIFDFDHVYTRDRTTIQGALNCINDVINDFGQLNPGEFTVVDEYGRIKSANLSTSISDENDEEGWINVKINPNVSETKISIRHNDAKKADSVLGQLQDQNLTFGDTFKAISFGIDEKGHVPSDQFKEYTMTMPKLDITDNGNKQIVTDLTLSDNGQSIVIARENVGNFALTGYTSGSATDIVDTDTVNEAFGKLQAKLNKEISDRIEDVNLEEQARIDAINDLDMDESSSTTQFISSIKQENGKVTVSRANAGTLVLGNEYSVATGNAAIDPQDSINSAVGKLEYKLNILNADSTQVGSVAYQIAQILNDNDDTDIDTLEEIAAWIINDTTGAAKMTADISKNANNIQALSNLVGNTAVATQIATAINEALAGDVDGTLKYALAEDLKLLGQSVSGIDGRVKQLEGLINGDKVTQWNAAEPNVISDWNETDSTSDKFIANKPSFEDHVKTSTTFEYSNGETTSQMTISQLFGYIATLEERIKLLEASIVNN